MPVKRATWLGLITTGLLITLGQASGAEGPKPARPDAALFEARLQPLVKQYCVACHGGQRGRAGITFDKLASADDVTRDRKTWQRVLRVLQDQDMPPEGQPQPSQEQVKEAVEWIEAVLRDAESRNPPGPGRVTLRRLNRIEYTHTIRDLLGVEFDATADFPTDDVGYGFDNIGDVLTLSPLLMEKYLAAAEQIAAKAIVANDPQKKADAYPESHRRIFFVQPSTEVAPAEAARQILERLATRAYRRPVAKDELDRLVRFVESVRAEGESLETAVQLALQAILTSPHFLFKVELDPPSADPKGARALNEYELATRLSYFLWSTMPDEELFAQAAAGSLRTNLAQQVGRMLEDAKAKALVANFGGQWLQWRNLATSAPDPVRFAAFDDELRQAMRTEAEMFFEAVVREDRSVLDLVDADFTFVNERLARHYGLAGVTGNEFRRVAIQEADPPGSARMRGGVITQASMLTVTSNPTRTSPVKRGKWILENILGTPPPDPPPDVPMLADDTQATVKGTLRQRMEQHRSNPTCAICHREMDAMGFALENFDAVGAWRTQDGDAPINAQGELADGSTFDGPAGLKAVLLGSAKDKFVRCISEKLLVYALGRGLEPYDRPAVEKITQTLSAHDYRFSALVLAVVQSEPFQNRGAPVTE